MFRLEPAPEPARLPLVGVAAVDVPASAELLTVAPAAYVAVPAPGAEQPEAAEAARAAEAAATSADADPVSDAALLARVRGVADATGVQWELLALLWQLLRARNPLDGLPGLQRFFERQWLVLIRAAAMQLRPVLAAAGLECAEDEIVELACRINTNAISVSDPDTNRRDAAFGVYPDVSLVFAHACAPNCVYYATPGRTDNALTFRALRGIRAGEQLTVCLVELTQPRFERRLEVYQTRFYICTCARCRVPISQSSDKNINGYKCRECTDGVYIVEEDTAAIKRRFCRKRRKNKKRVRKHVAKDAADDGDDGVSCTRGGAGASGSDPDSRSADNSAQDKDDAENNIDDHEPNDNDNNIDDNNTSTPTTTDKLLYCDKCPASIAQTLLEKEHETMTELFTQANNVFHASNSHPLAIALLRNFIAAYTPVLHKHNTHLFSARIPLLAAYTQEGAFRAALQVCGEILAVMRESGFFPAAHPDVADYELHYGALCVHVSRELEVEGKRVIAREMRRRAREAFRKAGDIRKVCFGDKHPRTVECWRRVRETLVESYE